MFCFLLTKRGDSDIIIIGKSEGLSSCVFMAKIYNSVEELIGGTPLIRLQKFEKNNSLTTAILAKVELFNPAGSIKDRAALEMVNDAEARGLLKEGGVIIEPTSGNTGIGLAAICASRGYRLIIVMPDNMSLERQMLMRAYGAELVLTDGALGMAGAIKRAEEIHRETDGSIIAGQFTNPANAEAHYKTTAPEIYSDTDGEIDIFVSCIGTGGTITGCAIREKRCEMRWVACRYFLGRGFGRRYQALKERRECGQEDRCYITRHWRAVSLRRSVLKDFTFNGRNNNEKCTACGSFASAINRRYSWAGASFR